MERFFCAQESRQAREDPIGNGVFYDHYILVESPPPWAPQALDSKSVPDNLRALKTELAQILPSTRLLLIYNPQLWQPNHVRCIILRRQTGFAAGYDSQEFEVAGIDQVAPALKAALLTPDLVPDPVHSAIRRVLVCTHGSNDQCCARFGNPFYRQAVKVVADLGLERVQIWQSSHFSGHRFAPTIIDFPEGRYYGRLDPASFQTLLTRSGNLDCFNHIYRGWGILPDPVQVLERELIFQHGWDWFNYRVTYQILDQNADESWNRVALCYQAPDGLTRCYTAEVIADPDRVLYLRGECSGQVAEPTPQYVVQNLVQTLVQVDG